MLIEENNTKKAKYFVIFIYSTKTEVFIEPPNVPGVGQSYQNEICHGHLFRGVYIFELLSTRETTNIINACD